MVASANSILGWSQHVGGVWVASTDDGAVLGSVTQTDRFTVASADGSVTGTHRSLDAAQSELEGFHRWRQSLTG